MNLPPAGRSQLSSLFTAVQHHPSRVHILPDLLQRLDGLNPHVVTDPGGAKTSAWRCFTKCLEAIPADASHVLIVQDDAHPCADFATRVHTVLQEQPHRVVALFASAQYVQRPMWQAKAKGARYLELRVGPFIPLVATIFPADMAREIVPFQIARKMGPHRADDAIVGAFIRAQRCGALATVPCLVEHRDDIPSVSPLLKKWHGKGKPHRVAAMLHDDHYGLQNVQRAV